MIDFRVLRHRQMWVGTLLGVVMGVGLYAMSFTLPVFLQNNLRMTAQQTGIVLLPGALATALSMVVVGRLSNKVDPRLVITVGRSSSPGRRGSSRRSPARAAPTTSSGRSSCAAWGWA